MNVHVGIVKWIKSFIEISEAERHFHRIVVLAKRDFLVQNLFLGEVLVLPQEPVHALDVNIVDQYGRVHDDQHGKYDGHDAAEYSALLVANLLIALAVIFKMISLADVIIISFVPALELVVARGVIALLHILDVKIFTVVKVDLQRSLEGVNDDQRVGYRLHFY